jgi:hypothetical protein
MNRKLTLVSVLLILALATLACGGGDQATTPPPAATEKPTAPLPTSPPAETEEEVKEEPSDYDTVFPLPDDAYEFIGDGGESTVIFQTGLSIDETVEFYRQALADEGLAEYEVLTSIEDDGFSMVFTSWPSGEEVVVQGVDFGDSVNVTIRLEEVVEGTGGAPPDTALGDELRSEMGGYACQTIPGYTVEEALGFASMEAPDADPDLGPSIMLIGGADEEEGTTPQELYDDFASDLETGVEVSEPREITVGGVEGLVADISGESDGKAMAGQIVFVAVNPTQQFIMFGAAPSDRWDDELAPQFDAVVASVTFFEPNLSLELGEEIATGDEIRQWAASATASSEYSDPNWAAIQATGAPDTFECGDYGTAWASESSDTVEWIELSFDTPVIPTEINIYQTYSPDQVTQVELIDLTSTYYTVYTASPQDMSGGACPYILSIPVEDADYQTMGLRITIDQSALGLGWNEIDAVELVGVSE